LGIGSAVHVDIKTMEPHGVFKEVTKQCTNKDHYQSVFEEMQEWLIGAGNM
jgi:hypothetical protein